MQLLIPIPQNIEVVTGKDYVLILADCMDILPLFKDKDNDVLIADPPYGIGESGKNNSSRSCLAVSKDYGKNDWDNERLDKSYINEFLRVSKEQVIFGGNYYADMLSPSPSWIVWDKNNGKTDFADCELAWTSHKRAIRKISWTWHGMIRQGNDKRFHPTQKPEGVMRWILERYSSPNDVIIDPVMGSGTTGVACLQTGRRFIGIEKSPQYFKDAVKRLQYASLQYRMGI